MKKLGRIAAAFMASVFFLTGIPAMTAFAADEILAAEEVVTETPAVEPAPETPAPETPAPETPDPVVVTPENGGEIYITKPHGACTSLGGGWEYTSSTRPPNTGSPF